MLASRMCVVADIVKYSAGMSRRDVAKIMIKVKVKVGFLYSATYTANQNSALHNLGSGS